MEIVVSKPRSLTIGKWLVSLCLHRQEDDDYIPEIESVTYHITLPNGKKKAEGVNSDFSYEFLLDSKQDCTVQGVINFVSGKTINTATCPLEEIKSVIPISYNKEDEDGVSRDGEQNILSNEEVLGCSEKLFNMEPKEESLMKNKEGRSQVFICYSHKDEEWLDKLNKMLVPIKRKEQIDVWSDKRIDAGAKWKEEIKKALANAKIAVLLVSDDFLASEFIAENELPPILDAAKEGDLRIIWIYLRHCLFEETAIGKYQAGHTPLDPIEEMKSFEQQKVFKSICKSIIEFAA